MNVRMMDSDPSCSPRRFSVVLVRKISDVKKDVFRGFLALFIVAHSQKINPQTISFGDILLAPTLSLVSVN